ncbi:MAG TPA: TonB-dependent receptor [Steroidobacteraceae bacterium]|nr:TonB-dependent receptor [Steroidobacteraceae bacterium]
MLAVLVALLALPAQAEVRAPDGPTLKTRIPRERLSLAIAAFISQTDLSYGQTIVDFGARMSDGAAAGLGPAAALKQLLKGTGLTFRFESAREFTISPDPPAKLTPEPLPQPEEDALEPIIVTAMRLTQRADQLPMSISVLTQGEMQAFGIESSADVGARTPGMEYDFLSHVGAGVYTNLAMRGVSDRHGTVTEIFLDDMPIPEVRSNTFGRALPSTYDLNRVETPRGPQGTIMGANTQGGAIRYVPNEPTNGPSVTSGAQAEWALTEGGKPTYAAGSWIDAPLGGEAIGLRVSAWYRSDGGFVDLVNPFSCVDPVSGRVEPARCQVTDANDDRVTSRSMRAILTYRPGAALRITPAVDYESNSARDSSAFFTYLSDPAAGALYNGSLSRQPASDSFFLPSLKVTADLGITEFNAVTAYFDRSGSLRVEDSESYGWGDRGNPLGFDYPRSYADAISTGITLTQRTFSQEFRLSSADSKGSQSSAFAPPEVTGDTPYSWFIAAAYSSARYQEADRVTAPSFDLDVADTTTTVQDHWALFGDLAHALGRHFSLAAGLRLERDSYDSHDLGITAPVVHPAFSQHAAETNFVPRFDLNYWTGENHVYLSAAKGFSPAGVDAALPTCDLSPTPYPRDTLWSYELADKSTFFEETLHVTAAVFDTRWNNGPTVTGNCLFRHMPGTAQSDGFEFEAQWHPSASGFTAGIATTYTDSRYTQTILNSAGAVLVRAGDAVGTPPLVAAPWTARLTADKRVNFPQVTLNLRAEDILRTRNPGPFYTTSPDSAYYAPRLRPDPTTNLVNLRLELAHGRFSGQIYLDNALDSQPTLLSRNKGNDANTLLNATLLYAVTLRPRTLGMSLTWRSN